MVIKYFPLIIGVIAGAVIAFIMLRKGKSREKAPRKDDGVSDFSRLIAEQAVCDTVDSRTLSIWFENQKAQSIVKGELRCFLAKPTREMSHMLGLGDPPSELDMEHNMLQIILGEKNTLAAVRLISFRTIPKKVQKMLDEEGMMAVK